MDSLAEKFIHFINTPWTPLLLFTHSFLESFFLPGAHDFFLIGAAILKPSESLKFAFFSTLGSTCGGCSAYLFARYVGRTFIEKVIHKNIASTIEKSYQKFGMWAVAFAGFTPAPYKLFALCSGFFEINFLNFAIVSFVARGARFFTLSFLIMSFGPKIKEYIVGYFNIFSIIILSLSLVVYLIVKTKKSITKNV